MPSLQDIISHFTMEAFQNIALQSTGVWSIVIPLCAFLTGGIVVQCYLYILNNPDEPAALKWFATVMTLIQGEPLPLPRSHNLD